MRKELTIRSNTFSIKKVAIVVSSPPVGGAVAGASDKLRPHNSWRERLLFFCINMDTECASHEISSSTEKTNVVEVESVVQSWMVDYYFATLCRHFKARSGPEFHKALKIFEGKKMFF